MSRYLYWLVSYPRSGNTWMRIFLTNYHQNSAQPADINQLDVTVGLNSRQRFDGALQVDSAHLRPEELDQLRPLYYRLFARQNTRDRLYCKIHDAFQRLPNGQRVIPADFTAGAIYVIRSPLDVAISAAHYSNRSIDKAIEYMNQADYTLQGRSDDRSPQLPQRLFSWSGHVRSWVDQADVPALVVRYEDMLTAPSETFTRVIHFIGGEVDAERIERAIRQSSFQELKKQEAEKPFREKPPQADAFFRAGQSGSWRSILTAEQVERIVQEHHEVMERFGYWPLDNS